jgi:hypothetical protein
MTASAGAKRQSQGCGLVVEKRTEIGTKEQQAGGLFLNFEPIIQVLDFVNKLYSSKLQVPGPGALVEGAGDLT